MKTVEGGCELLLTCEPAGHGLRVLRCDTAEQEVCLPDTVEGLPVTEIGRYAFSTRRMETGGPDQFEVRVTAGSPAGEIRHDAAAIRSISLPESVTAVGDYAFYNCSSLEKLTLGGALGSVGSDAFMNCFRLRQLEMHSAPDGGQCLQQVLREYSGELTVRLLAPQGEARLLFPAYSEEYEELAAPHIFHYSIDGAGYAYRQCFNGRAFSYSQYDGALVRLLQTHEFSLAVRAALLRLRFPLELGGSAAEAYRRVLREYGRMALALLLEARDDAGLSWLLNQGLLDAGALDAGCDEARRRGRTEALGLLLEARNRLFGTPRQKEFEL